MTRIGLILSVVLLACYNTVAVPAEISGTWGGENAGLIVTDTSAHVHIGCTLGDTKGLIHPDAEGNFTIDGSYNVDAYPVDRGITHPARFTGKVAGNSLTLTVSLLDTARTLGPVTLTYGKEPKMGPCPICRKPQPRANLQGATGRTPISVRNR